MARLVRWQALLAVLGILAVGGLLAQLSLTRQAVVLPVHGGSYTEGVVGTVLTLNPLLASTDAERAIVPLLFDGLSRLEPDGSVVPALAERWEISSDGTVYTCTLRSGLRWHDGMPVTSADVLYTLSLVRSPELGEPGGLAELWKHIQVEALDARRVRFVLERPYSPFLSYTAQPILPSHLLKDVEPSALVRSDFNLHPVGTGPFRVAGMQEGSTGLSTLDLEANPYFYGRLPYLETVRFRFYRDEGELLQALLDQEIDGAFGISSDGLARVADRSDLVVYRTYVQACTILFLNTRSLLLTDRRVRQALALGLDLPALLQELKEPVFPANGPISPISWAYKPDLPPFRHDLDAANHLLDESGWYDQNGDGLRDRDVRSLELTLLTRDIPPERLAVARKIKEQLAPLGIAVRVVVEEDPTAFRQRLEARDYDLLLYGWGQLGRDPDGFALWHSSQAGPGGLNLSGFQNSEADRLLEQGRLLQGRDERTRVYWQFQELFMREVPAIPLYYPEFAYVVSSRVRGIDLAPLNDLGDRFRTIPSWYVKTQKVILGRSRPVEPYRAGERP
ncbi:MAG: peptide ABC transporter substrate-binding protein [Chloroflexia bacterium]